MEQHKEKYFFPEMYSLKCSDLVYECSRNCDEKKHMKWEPWGYFLPKVLRFGTLFYYNKQNRDKS